MNILVVDDDNIIRRGLKKLIERLFVNHKVIADFQNGCLAYDYLKENHGKVDLVITDIKMPRMTGIELIEETGRNFDEVPLFVVLSGYDEFNYVRDSMKFGAFNYLLKPIKTEELKSVIKEAEDKIYENKNKGRVIEASLDILKKDFFKKILFSKKEFDNVKNSALLDNIQLDEDYTYKLIVLKRIENKNIISEFIKDICDEFGSIENIVFYYKNSVYILFYFSKKIIEDIDNVCKYIVKSTDKFISEEISTYILETTEDVWNLRNQSEIMRNIETDNMEMKAKKYFLNDSKKLHEILKGKDDTNSSSTVIRLAKDYIINNFNKNITLKDVAEEVFLSQNYLSELFKKETGEGFYDFISKYRIRKAKEILITTNLKIYEVAERVGYSDSITFGRAFKKLTGVTPNSYRNDINISSSNI
ncbi:MAG: response regulator [Clostridium butyricum]|nr:response regulator [Clostridium butyricum]